MPHERCGRKSKRLQGGDLFALRRHQPAERHIEQKCRDAEENEGNRRRHHLLLVEFVLQKPVGRLIATFDSANRTVRLKQAIELGDHRLRVGARGKRNDGIVERAFQVECSFRSAPVDPQHGEETVVGDW